MKSDAMAAWARSQLGAPVTVTATEDGYIRASYVKVYATTLQIEIGEAVTAYEPYKLTIPRFALESALSLPNLAAYLPSKTILNLGDSIGTGAGNSNVGYAHMIATKYSAILDNRASSGATVSDEVPANNIQLQLAAAIAASVDPDIVFVEGGTNDITYTLGAITADYDTELDTSTFCGGLESVFQTIRDTWPSAIVIYITPHHMRKSLAAMTSVFANGVLIAQKYCVPVVNLYIEGGLNTRYIPQSVLYTQDTYETGEGDGTHPNEAGYEKWYVPHIEAKLAAIIEK